MKTHKLIPGVAALALSYFVMPIALRAADSPEIAKLLADAKAQAVALKADAVDMESFTRSASNWETYLGNLDMIKEHVNKTGTLLTKLKDVEASGSPWQQTAIKQIEPLLKEIADNTTATINHLSDNKNKVHLPVFKDYVKANYELAADLEALIRGFVDYGNAKEKFEGLGSKLEIRD